MRPRRRILSPVFVWLFAAFCLVACAQGSSAQSVLGPRAPIAYPAPSGPAPEWGVNMRHMENETALDIARASGFSFVRTDLIWAEAERDGAYDFSFYDSVLDRLEAHGLGALLILDYGHDDHGGHHMDSPELRAAFLAYVRAAVRRYKNRNVRWEIWNEPDVDEAVHFIRPDNFALLVRETAEQIRAIDRDAVIVSGGLSWIDRSYARGMLEEWRRHGGPAIDAFGIHPYRREGPESALDDMEDFQGLLRRYDRVWPLWITEWGYAAAEAPGARDDSGHSEAGRWRQSVLAPRWALTAWMTGAPVAVWYEMVDRWRQPYDSGDNYGLLTMDNAEKPALRTMRVFFEQTRDARLLGYVGGLPDNVMGLRFRAPGRDLIALWVVENGGEAEIAIERRRLRSITVAWGDSVAGDEAGPSLRLSDEDGPVYVVWER